MQILLVDEAVSVLVDHVERLFELLDLRLVEHGEDVGGGPLGALLGGLSLGTLARHGGGWMWTCAHSKDMNPGLDCNEAAPTGITEMLEINTDFYLKRWLGFNFTFQC